MPARNQERSAISDASALAAACLGCGVGSESVMVVVANLATASVLIALECFVSCLWVQFLVNLLRAGRVVSR